MYKKHLLCLCLFLLPFSSCKRNASTTTDAQNAHDTLASVLSQRPVDATRSDASEGNAMSKGWTEIKPLKGPSITRCLAAEGCAFKGKTYLAGTEIRNDDVFCGENPAIEFVKDYYCEPTFSAMRCMSDSCSCGQEVVMRDALCIQQIPYSIEHAFERILTPLPGDETEEPEDDGIDEEEGDTPFYSNASTRSCAALKDEIQKTYGKGFGCIDAILEDDTDDSIHTYYHALPFCNQPTGCKTPDGRRFRYKMHDPWKLPGSEIFLFEEEEDAFCPYHLEGEANTTAETRCETGDCVWPKDYDYDLTLTQQIVLLEQKDQASSDAGKVPVLPKGYQYIQAQYHDYFIPSGMDISVVSVALPNTAACDGGKRYCHGTSNAPIPAPNAEGYLCQAIYDHDPAIKEWVCTLPEGCSCGDQTCAEGAACTHGVCTCNGIVLTENAPYICRKNTAKYPDIASAVCQETTCPCGSSQCTKGTVCRQNACYCGAPWNEKQPSPDFECVYDSIDDQYHWICKNDKGCGKHYGISYMPGDIFRMPMCWSQKAMTKDGCMCGEEPWLSHDSECLTHTKYGHVNVCSKAEGQCYYANRSCQIGEYMLNGECVVPDPQDGEAAQIYGIETAYQRLLKAVYCDNTPETCLCGRTTCRWGDYCINGVCSPANVTIDRFGQKFHYRFEAEEFDLDFKAEPLETKAILRRMLYGDWAGCISGLRDDAWIDQHVRDWKLTSGEGDDISTYYCSLSHDCTYEPKHYAVSSSVGNVVPFDWFCIDKENCLCGKYVCPDVGHCMCVTKDGKLSCGCEEIDAYEGTWPTERVCSDTVVETDTVDRYRCIHGLGFVCADPDEKGAGTSAGCPCGKIQCALGTVCIKPGVCTKDIVYPMP